VNTDGATSRTLNRPEAVWQARQTNALAETIQRTTERLCAAIGDGPTAADAKALHGAAVELAQNSRRIVKHLEAS
jgi:hypothetical protein